MKAERKPTQYPDKTLIILRGLPGSGKDYLVRQILLGNPGGVICSADDYFMAPDGQYRFEREKLGQAHHNCLWRLIQALNQRISLILLNNTNVTWKEFRECVEYGAIAEYRIILRESEAPWRNSPEECFKRNVHNVPLETIQGMHARYHTNEEIRRFAWEVLQVKIE